MITYDVRNRKVWMLTYQHITTHNNTQPNRHKSNVKSYAYTIWHPCFVLIHSWDHSTMRWDESDGCLSYKRFIIIQVCCYPMCNGCMDGNHNPKQYNTIITTNNHQCWFLLHLRVGECDEMRFDAMRCLKPWMTWHVMCIWCGISLIYCYVFCVIMLVFV